MAKGKKDTKKKAMATVKSEAVQAIFQNDQDEVPEEREFAFNPKGRPSKFTPSIITKTYEYIQGCKDEFFNYQKGFGNTDTYERRVMADLPTLEGLALHLMVHRDTIHDWSKKNKDFSDALEMLLALQKQRLIQRGISNDYNPTIAKLILSANHGMKERVDQTTDDKPLPQPIINVPRNHQHEENKEPS